MAQSVWRVDGDWAELCLPTASARFDWRRPAMGLTGLQADGRAVAGDGLLQVELADVTEPNAAAVECYERGGDLVVTYGELPSRPLRAQLYLRSGSHALAGASAAIELVASVQTSLLDSNSQLAVRSRLAAAAVWRLTAAGPSSSADVAWQRVALQPGQSWAIDGQSGAGSFLLRLPGEFSYAEFVHPLDFHQTTLTMQDPPGGSGWPQVQLRHELFARRLEKGVILRARVLGVLLPRAGDLAAALEHYQAFAASEPPLTT